MIIGEFDHRKFKDLENLPFDQRWVKWSFWDWMKSGPHEGQNGHLSFQKGGRNKRGFLIAYTHMHMINSNFKCIGSTEALSKSNSRSSGLSTMERHAGAWPPFMHFRETTCKWEIMTIYNNFTYDNAYLDPKDKNVISSVLFIRGVFLVFYVHC